MPKKILIIEDNYKTRIVLQDDISDMGYSAILATTGEDGLLLAKSDKPDLIVLDIGLPGGIDGLEVCKKIRQDERIRKTPIIVLTGRDKQETLNVSFELGADDYVSKPYDPDELKYRINALLRRAERPPFDRLEGTCKISLSIDNHKPIMIRSKGKYVYHNLGDKNLQIDLERIRQWTEECLLISNWGMHAKMIGKEIYSLLSDSNRKIIDTSNRALATVGQSEKLTISFESSASFFNVPVEFLYDNEERDGYFCLKYPISRKLMDVNHQNPPLSVGFLNQLWEEREQLKILLIASNTDPQLPYIDEEILLINKISKEYLEKKRIPYKIEIIPTKDATLNRVQDILNRCPFHILHIAAHGNHSERHPDKSFIQFWEKENCKGEIKRLSSGSLNLLLSNSKLRFVYLSCCKGTNLAPDSSLVIDDFPSIALGIAKAGIPAVMGFRGSIKDSSAKKLAESFYSSLYSNGSLDFALFEARQKIAIDDRDDISWILPTLILQE
ncbi:response regulator [uncultured Desulfobacter sp.]|uniref:response regulator n=1 Tax=uncultured Desulfobacter sp. TaxID=240139 RepID=UPI0029F5BA46|nr:response regulator [uncultured Desulfobacter sp.]